MNPSDSGHLLVIENVSKVYQSGEFAFSALQDVSVTIDHGAFAVLAGPSGSGKTSLLNIMGCLDTPTSGQVTVAGLDTTRADDNTLSHFRGKSLGFVFQTFNLIPVLNVYENIEYPLRLQRLALEDRKHKTLEMAEAVGLEGMTSRLPSELSAGQRQRVAIARALVNTPALVLADEPTANLDSETGAQIVDLMHALRDRYGTGFVLASHDPMVIGRALRHLRLRDGRLLEDGEVVSP